MPLGGSTAINGKAVSGLAGHYFTLSGCYKSVMKKTTIQLLLIAAIVLVTGAAFAQSCPMCKESMTAAGKKLSDGFYYSIISMAFLPMSLVSGAAVFVIKSSYQKRHPESTLSTYGMVKEAIKERFSRKSSDLLD